MNEARLWRYAELIVRKGANVQPGQRVVVSADIEIAYFARKVAESAYDAGAAHVYINWTDEATSRMAYLRATHEVLSSVDPWRVEYYKYYDAINACYIFLESDDPELLSDVDPERIKDASKATGTAFAEHDTNISGNHVRWTIAGVPSRAWAARIYPDLSEGRGVALLWKRILEVCRVDEDPLAAWETHDKTLKEKLEFLNTSEFTELHFKNSLGTDICVKLPSGHYWDGGSNIAKDGVPFFPNIPTEEVYTIPDSRSPHGRVVASMPLTYNGVTVEDFAFSFIKGDVFSYTASRNGETLLNLVRLDKGAKRLGEVALVPCTSPIARMKKVFKNSLFDENASCHFALGKAYPMIHGYDNLSEEELDELGVNDSITHIDFMFGTPDLHVTGTTASGREVPIFINGTWA